MKKNKHFKTLISFILCYLLVVPFFPLQIVKAADTKSAIINNGSALVKEGDWLYYINRNYKTQKSAIYKIKTDGTQNKKISDINGEDFTIDGDWIYFKYGNYNTYRIKKDGTKLQNLKINSDNLSFVGEWIYYFNNNNYSLYKVKKDGTKQTQILKGIKGVNVVGNYIYFSKYNPAKDSINDYRANLDGGKTVNLDAKANDDFSIYKITNNFVYFMRSGELFRMKPDGSGVIKVGSGQQVYSISVINDDWIYDYRTQEFKKVGTSTVIKETGVSTFSTQVIGNYIQYPKSDYSNGNYSYGYYALKTDNSKKIKITDQYLSECINDGKYFYYVADLGSKGNYLNKFDISKGKLVLTKKL